MNLITLDSDKIKTIKERKKFWRKIEKRQFQLDREASVAAANKVRDWLKLDRADILWIEKPEHLYDCLERRLDFPESRPLFEKPLNSYDARFSEFTEQLMVMTLAQMEESCVELLKRTLNDPFFDGRFSNYRHLNAVRGCEINGRYISIAALESFGWRNALFWGRFDCLREIGVQFDSAIDGSDSLTANDVLNEILTLVQFSGGVWICEDLTIIAACHAFWQDRHTDPV